MRHCWQFISEFVQREDGPTAVEYAVMLALIMED
jgi:Flp pilus assembly pilin Flp